MFVSFVSMQGSTVMKHNSTGVDIRCFMRRAKIRPGLYGHNLVAATVYHRSRKCCFKCVNGRISY